MEVREKSGIFFVLFVCFSGMHKIESSGQNFSGECFAYLLNLLSTLLRSSHGKVREKSGNFVLNFLWQHCCNFNTIHKYEHKHLNEGNIKTSALFGW